MYINIHDKVIYQIFDDLYFTAKNNFKTTNIGKDIDVFLSKKGRGYLSELSNNKEGIENSLQIIGSILHSYYYLIFFFSRKMNLLQAKSYILKIKDRFLTPDRIQDVMKFYKIARQLSDPSKIDDWLSDTVDIWYSFTDEERIKYFDKSKKIYNHNISKAVIFRFLYRGKNRNLIFTNLLKEFNERKIIDVIVSKTDVIDYLALEKLSSLENTQDLYDFLKESMIEQIERFDLHLKKVRDLLQSKYVVPISSDYLRYHKDDFFYSQFITDKRQRKINIIVEQSNKIKNLYNPDITETEREKIYSLVKIPERLGILINYIEENRVLSRIKNNYKDKKIIEDENYREFINLIDNLYQRFNHFPKGNGINISLTKVKNLFRYTTIELLNSQKSDSLMDDYVEIRSTGLKDIFGLIGIAVPHRKTRIKLKDFDKKSVSFEDIKKSIYGSFNDKKMSKTKYWLFNHDQPDRRKDNKTDIEEDIIRRLLILHDYLIDMTYKKIFNYIKNNEGRSLYHYRKTIKNLQSDFKLGNHSNLYSKLMNIILYKSLRKIKVDEDKKDNLLIPLHNKREIEVDTKNTIYINAVCQHYIEWERIKGLDKIDDDNYNTIMFNYIKRFASIQYSGDDISYYVCKSCNAILRLYNYIATGSFDSNNNYVTYYEPLYVPLLDILKYKELTEMVEFVDRRLEKVSDVLNVSLYIGYARKRERDRKVKQIMDIILFMNKRITFNETLYKQEITLLKEESKNISKEEFKKEDQRLKEKYIYTIRKMYNSNMSILDVVDLNELNDTLTLNKVVAYIIAISIIDLTSNEITNLQQSKEFNTSSFISFKEKIFKNLKIKRSNRENDILDIIDLDILSFLLYIFSGVALKNKIWIREEDRDKRYGRVILSEQILIVHTVIDIINNLINVDNVRLDKFYKHVQEEDNTKIMMKRVFEVLNLKYFNSMSNLFKSKVLMKRLKKRTKMMLTPIEKRKIISNQILFFKISGEDEFVKRGYPMPPKKSFDVLMFYLNSIFRPIIIPQTYPNKDLNKKLTEHYSNLKLKGDLNKIHDILTLRRVKIATDIQNKKIILHKKEKKREIILDNLEKSISSKQFNNFLQIMDEQLNKGKPGIYKVYKDVYTINHHYKGFKRETPIFFEENKIQKGDLRDSKFFKTDVVYLSHKNVEYYYSGKNLRYVGYRKGRESSYYSKNLEVIHLKKRYSLKSMVHSLGVPLESIVRDKKELINWWKEKGVDRNTFIKNTIRHFNIIINKIKNSVGEVSTDAGKLLDPILVKYRFELSNITIQKDKEPLFRNWKDLYNIKFYNSKNFARNIKDIKFDNKSPEKYVKYDTDNNILIYYLIREVMRLLKNNPLQTSLICLLLYDFIKERFTYFNRNVNYDYTDKMVKTIFEEIAYEDVEFYLLDEFNVKDVSYTEILKDLNLSDSYINIGKVMSKEEEENMDTEKEEEGYDTYAQDTYNDMNLNENI
jgi:hypothetical protein